MISLHGLVRNYWQEGRRQYRYKDSERLQEVIQSQQTETHLCLDLGETWELPRLERDRGHSPTTLGHIPLGSGTNRERRSHLCLQ